MNTDDIRTDNSEMGPGDRKVRLRKEAMIFEQPRQAIGLLAAACTLVGVIVGFSMGLLANRPAAVAPSCHYHHRATAVAVRPVADNAVGFLGVQIRTGAARIDSGAEAAVRVHGARVVQVIPNTPAARAGLEKGDLIVQVDGDVVPDMQSLVARIRAREPHQSVAVGFWRDGRYHTVRAPLARLPHRLR